MAGTGAPESSAGHDISSGCDALQGAPGDDRRQVADIGSTNDFYKAATSGVTVSPIQGSGLQRRVTTATPFAPHGAGHQEGRRELSVDTRHHAASRGGVATDAIRRRLRVVSHRHLMRLHFLLDAGKQAAPGVDGNELGLWSGSRTFQGMFRSEATLARVDGSAVQCCSSDKARLCALYDWAMLTLHSRCTDTGVSLWWHRIR